MPDPSLPGQQVPDDGRGLIYPKLAQDPVQLAVREWFGSLESLRWMPLASFVGAGLDRISSFSALAPKAHRVKALASPSWDLHHGSARPGFSQSWRGGRMKTNYHRLSSAPVEPLLHEREFHGARADYAEVSEEFRLFHDLYDDRPNGRLLRIDNAADPEVAVRFHGESVWVLAPLVRQYQAARRLDLLLFIDSTVTLDQPAAPHREEWQTAEINASLVVAEMDGRWFSNFIATRIVRAPPVREAGVWPYEKPDDYFPEFIIGVDAMGNEIRFTCNPDKLANYFGANPKAPHYLTAVRFRREVLAKYHDNPALYSIEDGYLRCVGLWGFRMDNDGDDIVAHLGDLGRDLPARERDYWRSFNIAPTSGVGRPASALPTSGFSETAIRRGFLAQPTSAQSVDLRLQKAYRRLKVVWLKRFGWPVFREPEPGDAHVLQDARRPLRDTEVEFEALVRTLTKLYVDFLNEAELVRGLPAGPANEKGIGKLERWLRSGAHAETDSITSFLRDLQELRSKGAAHRKGSDYPHVLGRILGSRRRAAACDWLLERALDVTNRLIAIAEAPSQRR